MLRFKDGTQDENTQERNDNGAVAGGGGNKAGK